MTNEAKSARKPRLTLWLLIGAGALFVALLVAAGVLLREQIFQTFLDPGVPFQTYEAPPEPDYAGDAAWIVRPGSSFAETERPAIFFVHPTTYDGGEHWNAPYDRPQELAELEDIILPNYAAPFLVEEAGLYAPLYRQAALYTFMNNREDAVLARRFAYEDVRRAFDAFRDQIGDERAFVLVGVGQGALHGLGLLIDEIGPNEDLRGRMAAAYLLEAPVPMDLFSGPLLDTPPCTEPEDVRCVIGYATARSNDRGRVYALSDRWMSWTPTGELDYVEGRGLLCINPLLWTRTEDFAPARLHRGGAAAQGLSLADTPSPMPSQMGAQCQNGLLMIERPRSRALRRPGRLGEDRRVAPFNLFYFDLQFDAARRIAEVEAILEEERRYAPPLGEPEEVDVAPVEPVDGDGG
ncbi:DUF3089 domain-containing protein [Marinicauda salina]|uniref:DUF3089 domain-containing protein n=1 Tax=Marinicauda salina TaxID=2135793 RepID=A0A2U2BVJ2_9PROT|nr:DUF3089 domain-containing protein [Marinicauda salina]PWE18028.1 DUF3089 domain-containing protein [Marinicauda salina]